MGGRLMSDFSINLKEDKAVWDAFAATSPQRSIFVYSRFLDALGTDYDLVTCYGKGKIVAGAAIVYSAAGLPITGAFSFTQYQGILLTGDVQKAGHSRIAHEFKVMEYFVERLADNFKKFSLCHSWRLQDLRPFQWYGYHEPEKGQFKVTLRYTGLLDLRQFGGFDEYVSSVRTVRRQEYKKSSQTLRFQLSEDAEILDKLHAKTFERQNLERGPQDSFLVQSLCNHAIAGGFGKMGVAYLGDIPVSAVLFIYDDRTAYYLFGANDPEYRNTSAGAFLLMQLIKDAFENGFEEVDFVGVNSPNRGDFKISFNADLKSYFLTSLG
jgi:hypothetical protein